MDLVTVGKNLILFKQIASGTISFSTGATAAAEVSASIDTPINPISLYVCSVRNNATQTTIAVEFDNVREIAGSSGVSFYLTTTSYATSIAKDVIVEGMFAGNASSVDLVFSLGSAATAAEVISADYQIWECR